MPAAPCPNCGRLVDLSTGPDRPFCSDRCRLIDLGDWLTDGARSIPDDAPAPAASESRDDDEL
jgi:endogenous inhibitor of DNA gyrase (YacG/DUF329 family)